MPAPSPAHIMMKTVAKRQLIEDLIKEWHRRNPREAREIVRYLREVTAQDYNPDTGEYTRVENGDLGFVQIRFPAKLFYAIRAIIPRWGDDDADLKDLLQAAPDMFPRKMKKRIRGKKPPPDPRPRELIWTDGKQS